MEIETKKAKKRYPKLAAGLWLVAAIGGFAACTAGGEEEPKKPAVEAKADAFEGKKHMEYILFKKVDNKWVKAGSDKFLLDEKHSPINPQEPGTYRRDWKSYDAKGAVSEQHTGEVFEVK